MDGSCGYRSCEEQPLVWSIFASCQGCVLILACNAWLSHGRVSINRQDVLLYGRDCLFCTSCLQNSLDSPFDCTFPSRQHTPIVQVQTKGTPVASFSKHSTSISRRRHLVSVSGRLRGNYKIAAQWYTCTSSSVMACQASFVRY